MKPTHGLTALRHGASALILTAAMLHGGVVAGASVTPLPTPAPAPVQGPPDGMIPPPSTTPRIVLPTPSPTPTPVPTPSPVPAPSPTPAPTPAAPRAVPRTAAPVEAREPRDEGRPSTTATVEAPAASESATPPVADSSESAATSPSATPLPETAPLPDEATSGTPEWLPLAALGGVFALSAAGWWWLRRRRLAAVDAVSATVAESAPAKPKSVEPTPLVPAAATVPAATPTPVSTPTTAPNPPVRVPIGRRADVAVDFEAVSAQSTLFNFRLGYAVTLHNQGTAAGTPVLVRIGLFAGHNAHPQGVAQWYGQAMDDSHHRIESLPPGESIRFEGELVVPLDALNPLEIDGRRMAIPLIAVDARYHHSHDEAPLDGQTARAFVVGRDSGVAGAKLAPFRLDQGPTSFAPLGQRDTGISKTE